MNPRRLLRPLLIAGVLASALPSWAGQKPIYGFDDPFATYYGDGPISIATGTGYSTSSNGTFNVYYTAEVQANSDASGAQRLSVDLGSSLLQYVTGPDVDGTLTIEMHKVVFSGPNGYLPYDLGGVFDGLHLDFAQLDRDVVVSYQNIGVPSTFSGSGVVRAGTSGIDLPLLTSGDPVRGLYGIIVNIDAPKGTSFKLDGVSAITVVPEPASVCALGLGALAFVRRGRRSRDPRRLQR